MLTLNLLGRFPVGKSPASVASDAIAPAISLGPWAAYGDGGSKCTGLHASDLSSSTNIRHVLLVAVSSRMLNEPLAFIVIE